MNYVSYAQMVLDTIAWAQQLPQDFDTIIGIPRSGMLPASILALHWNVKLGSVDEIFKGGTRDRDRKSNKILVVDDSVLSGSSIGAVTSQFLKKNVSYGTLYVKPGSEKFVDYFYKRLPLPRIFQWNVFHGYWMKYACLDIDGVLCRDPTREENDDGVRYNKFLLTATRKHIPSVEIHTLVTSRLERYRQETEVWLRRNGVRYGHLIMHPGHSASARRAKNDHAERKAEVYKETWFQLFVESSIRQAEAIHKITKKPVLCIDNGHFYA